MINKGNTTLYCVYHKKEFETTYTHNKWWFESYYKPLVETDWFKPYFTLDNHPNSLDNLQHIFCEFTAIYYIYKNKLYSEYIGICHYDRQYLRYILENNFLTNKNIIYTQLIKQTDTPKDRFTNKFVGFLYDDIFEFIKLYYNENSRIYKYFITNYEVPTQWITAMNFICKWEYFEEIAKFLCEFIDWHNEKHKFNWDESRYKEYIDNNFTRKKDWKNLNNNEWYLRGNQYRIYAYVIEMLIGYYFGNLIKDLNEK